MIEVTKVTNLVSELYLIIQQHNHPITIGIDGAPGSGKSTLADELSKSLPLVVINIDDYHEKYKGGYTANIDYSNLAKEYYKSKDANAQPIILEGVCLLEVLERIEVGPEVIIYVKRIIDDGIWVYEDEKICDPSVSIDEAYDFINRHEKQPGQGDFNREVADYHRKYCPMKKANIVFAHKHHRNIEPN